MVKMIADKAFVYAGKQLQPNDKFDCEDHNAPGLEAIGHAHRARRTGYNTRALKADATGAAA